MSPFRRGLIAGLVGATIVAGLGAGLWTGSIRVGSPLAFEAQLCALPPSWRDAIQKGYFAPRSGQISILPKTPAYMASGAGGWSHSGPWPYLQRVPLVFYGPGVIDPAPPIERAVTLADVAPTIAGLLKGSLGSSDGRVLEEVASLSSGLSRSRPRLILTVVWDGGGWNALEAQPDLWPTLARVMETGVSYTNATVGSSPSVTPAIHTTLGTGRFPASHGITGVPVRDGSGAVVDAFLKGESSRFIEVPTLAERWDEQNDGRALVGMVGYEPWHLGMIGRGAERPNGDKDHAAWLNTETNEWVTNADHYTLPPSLAATSGLEGDLDALDAADGRTDRAWGSHAILDDPDRIEETPAFIAYHARALLNMIEDEGYGADGITDLLFTNFKQIDRVAHYFNMASDEVAESLAQTDRQLQMIIEGLDRIVGAGDWVLIVTADHGLQPDEGAIDGYGIDPNELRADVNDRFGDVATAVWPTEVFLDEKALTDSGATVAEIARFIADYRLADNVAGLKARITGAGRFRPSARLFELAVPSSELVGARCG